MSRIEERNTVFNDASRQIATVSFVGRADEDEREKEIHATEMIDAALNTIREQETDSDVWTMLYSLALISGTDPYGFMLGYMTHSLAAANGVKLHVTSKSLAETGNVREYILRRAAVAAEIVAEAARRATETSKEMVSSAMEGMGVDFNADNTNIKRGVPTEGL